MAIRFINLKELLESLILVINFKRLLNVDSLHAWLFLFDLILYVPVNNCSVMLGQVFLSRTNA